MGRTSATTSNPQMEEMRQNFTLHPQLTQHLSHKDSSDKNQKSGKRHSKSSFNVETPIQEEERTESHMIAASNDPSSMTQGDKNPNFSKYSGISISPGGLGAQPSLKLESSR